jgi:hypothetical protein
LVSDFGQWEEIERRKGLILLDFIKEMLDHQPNSITALRYKYKINSIQDLPAGVTPSITFGPQKRKAPDEPAAIQPAVKRFKEEAELFELPAQPLPKRPFNPSEYSPLLAAIKEVARDGSGRRQVNRGDVAQMLTRKNGGSTPYPRPIPFNNFKDYYASAMEAGLIEVGWREENNYAWMRIR